MTCHVAYYKSSRSKGQKSRSQRHATYQQQKRQLGSGLSLSTLNLVAIIVACMMTTLPDICKCMSRYDKVGGHGEHVTCHMFCLLRRPFFFFSICLGSRCAIARWPILTIYTSTICVFAIPLLPFPFSGISSPKHQFWGREDAFLSPTAKYWNLSIKFAQLQSAPSAYRGWPKYSGNKSQMADSRHFGKPIDFDEV